MPPRIEHRVIDDIEHKICNGKLCEGAWKPLDHFGTDKQTWDKLKTMCKNCKNFGERTRLAPKVEEIIIIPKVKEVKEVKELKPIGRPKEFDPFDIEDLLLDYGLYVLDDIEETDQPSKAYVHYTCDLGHAFTTRFDTIRAWIKEYSDDKRYAVCSDCNTERKELKVLIDNENLVEEKGFTLNKMYNNERGDLVYDILCKNNHLTEGRNKSSFIRSFSCKECKHNALEYICTMCQKLFPLDKFNKCETNIYRNKTDSHCIECRAKQRAIRKENNYKLPTRPTVIENDAEGKICCTKDCGFHVYSEYWSDAANEDGYDKYCKICKDKINKEYAENNKESIKITAKNYQKNNRERITSNRKEWIKNNKERHRKSNRDYTRNRRLTDPNYKLLGILRHRLYLALKGKTKSAHTIELLGCTIEELWIHLESQFSEGMTRENHGVWHVDHRIPCAAFNLTRPEEQHRCFNYRNLQPLWKSENMLKSDNYKFDIVREIELKFVQSVVN
jgi:hypothetical protein